MSVKTEQTNELVTFEQIDELAKEIYVQLVKDKADELVYALNVQNNVDELTYLSIQAHKLAEQWFLSQNERLKLWSKFNNKQLKLFYSSKENRMSAGWIEEEGTLKQNDDKKTLQLKQGASYWIIEHNSSTPEIGIFDEITSQKLYQFKTESDKAAKIKAILPKKIEP